MIRHQLYCTNGGWSQSFRPMGTRHHCQRPLQSASKVRGQQNWVGYSLLLGLSSVALSNGKCPLFSAFVPKAACFSTFLYLHFCLSHLVPRFGGTRPSPFVFGPFGATRCRDECIHVLGHLRCSGESICSSKPISFGGIEKGSLSFEDNLFSSDPSRPFPPSSHPSTSRVPSGVAPIVLDGAFAVNRCPFRVSFIRHVFWRVSQTDVLAVGGRTRSL